MTTAFKERGTEVDPHLPQYDKHFWDTAKKNLWEKLNEDVHDEYIISNPHDTIPELKRFPDPILRVVDNGETFTKQWSHDSDWN